MKKIYNNPDVKVIKIQPAKFIAVSPGYGEQTEESSGNLSRDFDWEDEEDY